MAESQEGNAKPSDSIDKNMEMAKSRRLAIWECCSFNINNGVLPRGAKTNIANFFGVHVTTVTNIMSRAEESLKNNNLTFPTEST
jgi:hypothetical protein